MSSKNNGLVWPHIQHSLCDSLFHVKPPCKRRIRHFNGNHTTNCVFNVITNICILYLSNIIWDNIISGFGNNKYWIGRVSGVCSHSIFFLQCIKCLIGVIQYYVYIIIISGEHILKFKWQWLKVHISTQLPYNHIALHENCVFKWAKHTNTIA